MEQAGISSARLEAELLLAHVQGCSRMELYLSANLSGSAKQEFLQLVARRCNAEPLQYCIGIAWFYGLAFDIGPGAFIPRQETEILCQQAIHLLQHTAQPTRVIDLCCGPGTIGITLTKNVSDCRITAIDASAEALSYARSNALRHGVEGRITFIQKDIRSMDAANITSLPQADLLLCNPPYVPTAGRSDLPADVLQEPWLALDGGPDGLDFYRLLIPRWHSAVREGGLILLEHGDDQGPAVAALLRETGAYDDIRHLRDLSGRERVVQATLRVEPRQSTASRVVLSDRRESKGEEQRPTGNTRGASHG